MNQSNEENAVEVEEVAPIANQTVSKKLSITNQLELINSKLGKRKVFDPSDEKQSESFISWYSEVAEFCESVNLDFVDASQVINGESIAVPEGYLIACSLLSKRTKGGTTSPESYVISAVPSLNAVLDSEKGLEYLTEINLSRNLQKVMASYRATGSAPTELSFFIESQRGAASAGKSDFLEYVGLFLKLYLEKNKAIKAKFGSLFTKQAFVKALECKALSDEAFSFIPSDRFNKFLESIKSVMVTKGKDVTYINNVIATRDSVAFDTSEIEEVDFDFAQAQPSLIQSLILGKGSSRTDYNRPCLLLNTKLKLKPKILLLATSSFDLILILTYDSILNP